MSTLSKLRDQFVSILDTDRGDGACALSLLDVAIESQPPTPTYEPDIDTPEIFSISEAIEHYAVQFHTEMTFDQINDLAVELLERRIIQLTNRLNEKTN